MFGQKYTWEQFLSENVRGYVIFLDIDGVLMADGEEHVPKHIREYVEQLKQHNDVHIVSNTIRVLRREQAAREVGLSYTYVKHGKPSKKILKKLSYDCSKPLMVVGDKILTDGIFAKRIGARLILLERRLSPNDRFVIKLTYICENALYRLLSFF